MKQFFLTHLNFSRRESRGIVGLMVLALLVFVLPKVYFQYAPVTVTKVDSSFVTAVNQLQLLDSTDDYAPGYKNKSYTKYSYNKYNEAETPMVKTEFYFDPNSATEADWTRLGIRAKTIRTIQNYLSKGGQFREPEDIAKIWGLPEEDAERLMPYVRIANSGSANNNYSKPNWESNKTQYAKPAPSMVDVNSADSTAFIALPGIGSKLANRIINYRNKLGGFYAVEQIAETFGLPDSTFQKIKARLVASSFKVKQININTATIEELKSHPYIKWQQGNLIIKYRSQHGNYKSIEEIKKIETIGDIFYNKIAPYLTVS